MSDITNPGTPFGVEYFHSTFAVYISFILKKINVDFKTWRTFVHLVDKVGDAIEGN